MRNLELYSIVSHPHFKIVCAPVSQSLAVNDKIYILFEATQHSQCLISYNCATEDLNSTEFIDGVYTNMEYLPFEDMVFLTTKNELVFLDGDVNLVKRIILDGEEDIIHAKWNGHQDVLAIFFECNKVSLYLVNVIEELAVSISSTNLDDEPIEHIDVGWGGTHKYKRAEEVPSTYVCDNQEPVIDWKGNGDLFAINYFDGEERIIKIYNKSCELLYSSKGIQSGLEPLLAFKPVGNVIACVTSSDGQDQRLMIIEKNCMLLSMIPLEEGAKVQKLLWSPCGTCITVQLKRHDQVWIDIYLIHNCHYSLKQRLPLDQAKTFVDYKIKPMLSGIFNLELHYNYGYYEYTFLRKFIRSNIMKFDYGLNVNVEGSTLKCYYFASGLSSSNDEAHYIHEHTCPINGVVFSDDSYKLIYIDSESIVYIYDYTDRYNWDLLYTVQLPKSTEHIPLNAYRLYMPNDTKLCVVCFSEEMEDALHTYNLTTVEPTCVISTTKKNIIGVSTIMDKKLEFYSKDINKMPIHQFFNVQINGSYHLLYMTVDGGLFIDHERVKEKISSLFVHSNRLTVTVINNELDMVSTDNVYGVYLTAEVIQTLKEGGSFEDISYKRPVEQGSVVLNTIEKSATTILLLPRGNIESIELRNIALFIVRDKLLDHKYIDALHYIKRQSLRIDLLVDLSPSHFFTNKVSIFRVLDLCASLNKFFVEIKNESSLNEKEMKLLGVESQLENKVVKVAESFEDVYLRLQEPEKHLMTYALAAYFTDRNIVETMTKVSKICNTLTSIRPADIVNAIEVISNHVDKKELYEASLFTFDLHLAELVASKSQMDPCVYRPFIQRVTAMDEFEMRFTICYEIGRFKEALFYYFQMYREESITGEEMILFATESELLSELYNMVDVSDDIFEEVGMLYYEILMNDQNYLEAGILANRLQRYVEAVTAMLQGYHWQEALTVIDAGVLTPEQSLVLYRTVANTMTAHRDYVDAANVLVNHCTDYDAAMQCYISAKEFELALRLSIRMNRPNFHPMIEDSMVIECQNLCSRTQELSEKFTKYYERLKVVRQKMKAEAEAEPLHDTSNIEFSDVMSVTTAASTISTRSSNRSNRSMTRRLKKEQKKYTTLKENSRYEDIALLYNLSILVDDVKEIQKAVNEMYCTIQLRNLDIPDVVTACELIDELIKHIDKYSPDIWREEFAAYEPKEEDKGVYSNLVHLDHKYRMKPELKVSSKERATIIFLKRR
ncbi:PREDICTED: elongator complex protein 1 [Nicrophorus vespilloides]|uniref:Elongator complex protein 1 n=1 Tax=Nicrophorus vespilloides TaxID=110193 RepID=A0ABM1NBS3_NICVS|nr:PREDICTED: elongator complex protein 1 [Nicrophorus vespilloides]